jgi:hypothetical protein
MTLRQSRSYLKSNKANVIIDNELERAEEEITVVRNFPLCNCREQSPS